LNTDKVRALSRYQPGVQAANILSRHMERSTGRKNANSARRHAQGRPEFHPAESSFRFPLLGIHPWPDHRL